MVYIEQTCCGVFPLADLGGGAPGARPPYGSRFFHFDMQNFWNVAASGVNGPPYEVHAPPHGKSWIRHWFHCFDCKDLRIIIDQIIIDVSWCDSSIKISTCSM